MKNRANFRVTDMKIVLEESAESGLSNGVKYVTMWFCIVRVVLIALLWL